MQSTRMHLFKHCAHYLLYDDVSVYADQRLKLLNNWMHFLNDESNVTSCTWSDVCVQLHRNRSGRDMIVKNQSKAPRNRRSLHNRYTLNHCFFGSKLGFSHILDLPSSAHRARDFTLPISVGQVSRNLNTTHRAVSQWIFSEHNFENFPIKDLFSPKNAKKSKCFQRLATSGFHNSAMIDWNSLPNDAYTGCVVSIFYRWNPFNHSHGL